MVDPEETMCFFVAGDSLYHPSHPETCLTVSIQDGKDLLGWLGYKPDTFGHLSASDLLARCRRRLWPIPRNQDPEVKAAFTTGSGGLARQIRAARPAGYLRSCTERLLTIALRADAEGFILFA